MGARVGVSRAYIGRIERGLVATVPVGTLNRCAEALGATFDTFLRWHGEALDRLLDEAHAELVDATVALYRQDGWEAAVEVSFSIDGERGSVDVLAWHPLTACLAVNEIKSTLPDSQAMLHVLDRKVRLAARIARERGWNPSSVSRILVVGESRTSRRRVERHAAMFDVAFPERGRSVRDWIARPTGRPISGLLFVAPGGRRSTTAGGRSGGGRGAGRSPSGGRPSGGRERVVPRRQG